MMPLVRRGVSAKAVVGLVGSRCPHSREPRARVHRCGGAWFSSSVADEIVLRLVSVNDVYNLLNLPKLATFVRTLGGERKDGVETSFDDAIPASAVTLNGDFLYPSSLSSIDKGRGHVAAIKASGVTHVCLGNHEADLPLKDVKLRLGELTQRNRVTVVNSNVASLGRYSKEMDVVSSVCGRIKVGLVGFLSDESGMFRDGTFKGLQIDAIQCTYERMLQKADSMGVDSLVSLTHQSLGGDRKLAGFMLACQPDFQGVILGGHEHVQMHEKVSTSHSRRGCVQIVKSGVDAQQAAVIDLRFSSGSHILTSIEVRFQELSGYEPCRVTKSIVDKHLQVLDDMQDFVLFDKVAIKKYFKPVDDKTAELSSKLMRYEQTTVGALFATAVKEELLVDVCIINGAPLKGDRLYGSGKITYSELKNELPFPLKMIVVQMTRGQLRDAIQYSRTGPIEEGKSSAVLDDGRVERRGYLQLDFNCWRDYEAGIGDDDEIVSVALPRNLLKGFCKNKPLMELSDNLQKSGKMPDEDDYIKAVDLIVRFACKDRWETIASRFAFEDLDLNGDGLIDRTEVRSAMSSVLGEDPSDTLVENMVDAIDYDRTKTINREEFSTILSRKK